MSGYQSKAHNYLYTMYYPNVGFLFSKRHLFISRFIYIYLYLFFAGEVGVAS
jgi:hypothetical protein